MIFERPDLLWAAPAAALFLVVAFGLRALRRRRLSRAFGGRGAARRLTGVDLHRLPALRYGAVLLGAAALALAGAGPRDPEPPAIEPGRAIDAVVVIDISTSMGVDDEDPSRLKRGVAAVEALLSTLPADRVGLVAYAHQAYPLAPPTGDHEVVRYFLDALEPELLSRADQGTRTLEGLRTAADLLERRGSPEAHRAIVLVTDGESHDEEARILDLAQELSARGIRVFALGVGTEDGVQLVQRDYRGNPTGPLIGPAGEPVVSRMDRARLTRIAEAGGGAWLGTPTEAVDEPALRLLEALGRERPRGATPGGGGRDLPYRLGLLGLLLLVAESGAQAAGRRRALGRRIVP